MKKKLSITVKALITGVMMSLSLTAAANRDAPRTGSLKLTVNGIEKEGGTVLIAVGEDYNNPGDMVSKMVKAKDGSAECTLYGIPQGETNIYIFHDENGNFNLDRSEEGIPLEGCYAGKISIEEQKENSAVIRLEYHGASEEKR